MRVRFSLPAPLQYFLGKLFSLAKELNDYLKDQDKQDLVAPSLDDAYGLRDISTITFLGVINACERILGAVSAYWTIWKLEKSIKERE